MAFARPHIGWNQLEGIGAGPVLEGIPEGAYAYFLHSYYAAPSRAEDRLATTEYGGRFASVVGRSRVVGIQFHPEKSGRLGARVLRNFVAAG